MCFNFRKTARALTQLYDGGLHSSGIRSTQFVLLVGIAKSEPVPIGRLSPLGDEAAVCDVVAGWLAGARAKSALLEGNAKNPR